MRSQSGPRGLRASLVQIRASRIHGNARRSLQVGALVAVAALASLGCIGSAEDNPLEVATGKEADVSHDGLVRMTGSSLEGVWAKPDADIGIYRQLLLKQVLIAYKRKPTSARFASTQTNFALSRDQVERLEQLFQQVFLKQIEKTREWKVTEEPGTDVLTLQPFLLDLVVNTPTDTSATETVYTTSTGSVTLVLEVRDSLSNEILARVMDRSEARAPGVGANNLYASNAVTNQEAVRLTFDRWARIFMARLDTARRLHPTQPLDDPTAGGDTKAAP